MSICYYCSVGNPCLILCDSMNSSIPGSFISSLSPRVCSNSCPWSWWRESASLVAQAVENPPAMRDTCVQPLGWEDPLEKGMATHSSILALRIPCMDEWRATVRGVAKHWTWLSNWAHTAISSSPAPFLLSSQHQGLFLWVDSSITWPKYWRFSFSSSPSNETSGLISFGSPWLVGLLAVLGTLKSLLQDHNSKASILQCSAIFMGQLTHLYITTGTTIGLTIQTNVSKVLSLFSNMLFAFVIASLPQSKCLLISWLQLESAVILDPEKIKYATTSTFSYYICHEVMRPDTMIF